MGAIQRIKAGISLPHTIPGKYLENKKDHHRLEQETKTKGKSGFKGYRTTTLALDGPGSGALHHRGKKIPGPLSRKTKKQYYFGQRKGMASEKKSSLDKSGI